MSYASAIEPLRKAVTDTLWRQWGTISFGAAVTAPARAIVDLEALLLASAAHDLDRINRLVAMWRPAGARLVSTSRYARLARDYPRHPGKVPARSEASAVEDRVPELRFPATLLLRLRMFMGVGIKADSLTFLLGRAGAGATMREIASATGYYGRAVRRGVEDLVAARLVHQRLTSPASYFATWPDWAQLLRYEEDELPLWRYWHELYAASLALTRWADQSDAAKLKPYVAASRLRDVFERIMPLLMRAQVSEVPDWAGEPVDWLDAFAAWSGALAKRLAGIV